MKLIDYIRGDRRGREANDFEKRAMDDPFLSDAVEGYDAVYGNHFDMVKRLEEWVDNRSARRRLSRRRTLWGIGAAAAVVLAAAGVGYHFYNDRNPGDFTVGEILRDRPLADEISMAAFREHIPAPAVPLDSAYYAGGVLHDSVGHVAGVDARMDSVARHEALKGMIAGIVKLSTIEDAEAETVEAGDIVPAEGDQPLIAENIVRNSAENSQNTGGAAHDNISVQSAENINAPAARPIRADSGEGRGGAGGGAATPAEIEENTLADRNGSSVETVRANIDNIPNESVPAGGNTMPEGETLSRSASEDGDIETVSYAVFDEYFSKNRRLRSDEQGHPLRGDVVVEFRVNDAGVPSAIRIISSFSQDANREAIELLIEGPRWTPTHGRRIRAVISYR